MLLEEDFSKFLADEVNLNKSRLDQLNGRVETIERFLWHSDWGAPIARFAKQGSWAHKTIIKPPGDQGFDADLVAYVHPVAGWTASDYLLDLRRVFLGSGTYRDMTTLRSRCVTLGYAGDFDIDVVPCVVNRPGGAFGYEVCNRKDDVFEPTDGEAYTEWLEQRDRWCGIDTLREVVRLLKYLRDIKTTFSCKSILLTTMLGEQISSYDAIYEQARFADLPTALLTLVGRLDDYLQANQMMPNVCNPVVPGESFTRHWDDDKYEVFRDAIHRYREWIEDAYGEADEERSRKKWQDVFGAGFGRGAKTEVARIDEAAAMVVSVNRHLHFDAVEALKKTGFRLLETVKSIVPWMEKKPWKMKVSLHAYLRCGAHGAEDPSTFLFPVNSGDVLPRGCAYSSRLSDRPACRFRRRTLRSTGRSRIRTMRHGSVPSCAVRSRNRRPRCPERGGSKLPIEVSIGCRRL